MPCADAEDMASKRAQFEGEMRKVPIRSTQHKGSYLIAQRQFQRIDGQNHIRRVLAASCMYDLKPRSRLPCRTCGHIEEHAGNTPMP